MPHRSTVLALLLTVAALTGLVGWRSVASSSSGGASDVAGASAHDASFDPPGDLPVDRHGALGLADGELPDGVTAFDDEYPAVAELDPELLDALRRASTAASSDGAELV